MQSKYNAVMSGTPPDVATSLQGNRYTTTIHLLLSAIDKLRQTARPPRPQGSLLPRVSHQGSGSGHHRGHGRRDSTQRQCGLQAHRLAQTRGQSCLSHPRYDESRRPLGGIRSAGLRIVLRRLVRSRGWRHGTHHPRLSAARHSGCLPRFMDALVCRLSVGPSATLRLTSASPPCLY